MRVPEPTAQQPDTVPARGAARRWGLLCAVVLAITWLPPAFAQQIRDSFDHLTTGFELLGQHRDLPCESCHANAVFKGTPRDCSACHGIGTAIRATAKTPSHILSTERCDSCHTPNAWVPAVNFDHAEARGSCSTCHNNVQAQGKGPQHIQTDLECDACHSTLSWSGAIFNHSGVTTGCASCHNGVQATGMPANHIPTSGTACEACHSTTNFTTFAGTPMNHAAVTGQTCQSCHETAAFLGMAPSTATTAGDSRPPAALDRSHPTSGDCGQCHDTSSFTSAAALRPANHIPTNAPCTQCHTTPGQNALFSVTGVHQGVTECLSCHGPTVAGTFANISIITTPGNHIPIGSLDCNGSGCHTTANVNPGGFNIGSASITVPTLNTSGHTTVAGAVAACQTCHQSASYLGMLAGTTTVGDSRPSTALDASHPATGDCGSCHTTTPTFAGNVTNAGKPANHIPTTAACNQCHMTAGNYAAYSVTGTHQGVTTCLSCHGPTVATTFDNVTITTTPGNHIPIGALDCNGSGCHTTANVNAGGFNIGTANITSPTLNATGHTTVAAAVAACQTCHQAANYLGMLASGTTAGDSRPSTALDATHPTAGDCGSCHTTTPTFASDVTSAGKPANHIPTTAACTQCHTTVGNYAVYSVTGTHQGVTTCLTCHGPTVANTFANVTITTVSSNHIPIGGLDCNRSGCHTTANVGSGGFSIGTANINSPTLNTAGHTTVATAVAACQTCHEAAPYQGMIASSGTIASDSRPSAALDSGHPTTGDCGSCHLTTPTFASDVVAGTKPANHIPTTAACTQCHTTAGNFAVYSVTGTHQGVTNCLSCHGSTVATTFANVTITTLSSNHIPIGGLDCNGSGCHTTTNVNSGGFNIGTANISRPTLTVAGHTTVAAAVATCQTCHESAPYQGMLASSATAAGDSRPTAFDKNHPTSGDCGGCHTTTPTFSSDVSSSAKPANHIPTTAACAQCHTTAGNYALYSVTGTHQGVTNCLSCHGPTVATTFANITITTLSSNHIPIGGLDCNGSGCHTTANVNSGGFNIGTANINSPTLTVAGHTTVLTAVTACQTCHQAASYQGMIASTATAAADSRPTAFDKSHPTTGDCGGCHTSTPTFASNVTSGSKPANHIPTNAPCAQCHTTAGNYGAYVMGTTGHTGITSGCAQCHADGLTFANMAPPTLVEPPTGPTGHVPVGSIACEQCHSVTNFTTFSGTVMKHTAVRANACDSCHEYGMTWKTNTGVRLWTRPEPSHHKGLDCGGSGCHTSRDKHAVRPAATAAVASLKATAAVAATKPATHIATTNSCSSCHTAAAWLPISRMDHTQVIGACASCHNGTIATGKASSHIRTAAACDACHTTNAWMPARFDHATLATQACVTCHNGVRAIGKPLNHIRATLRCGDCHNTIAWTPVKLDHATLTTGCASCHNNSGAVGTPTGHMSTRLDCASCHAYPDWSLVRFTHVAAAYPGNHRATLTCVACHTTDTDGIAYASPPNSGTCAGCHAKDFKPEAHPKTVKGVDYTASELRNCGGACHLYSDSTLNTIARRLPGPHHRVTDATFHH